MQAPKVELTTVTPQMAENWLNHAMFERQRQRRDWHVVELATELRKGQFIQGTQIHFGVVDGLPRLINGQHVLAAIARSGIPAQLTVLSTPVDDPKELGQLYGRHDRHRGRSPHDAFLALGTAEDLGLTEVEANAFGAGLRWVLNDFRRISVVLNPEVARSIDFLAKEMPFWQTEARWYFECVRQAKHGMKGAFRRLSVVSVGLATFAHEPDKAREFWTGAALDDGLHRLDPRRALNDYLASKKSDRGDQIIRMRYVAASWNRFYQNGEMQVLRPGDTGRVGVTILGTPFKAIERKSSRQSVPVEDDDGSPMPAVQGELGEVRA